ncbi:solute carrier family 46 member 3-like [Lingula anatina]|uniref:Solute carrier family 46 member 3-like n=1 Tax=Lingula anatina TaxID=7574 RepID=A0A1S3I429_LINAN|nr:solute carrier family 46 member 3-like [Lingula anatina]|eukprot:XP_013392586.1 solute carrier family 46 member 3-like [Lingula anatina]
MESNRETDPLLSRGNGLRHRDLHTNRHHKELVDIVDMDMPKFLPKCPVTVEPYAFFYFFAILSLFSIFPQYFYKRIGEDLGYVGNKSDSGAGCEGSNDTNSTMYALQQKVQAESSLWLMYTSICTLVPAIIVTVFYGGHSDTFGRKPSLILPCLGSLIRSVFTVFAVYFEWPLWSFLPVCFVEGLFGQYATALMGCFTYISDITTTKNRAFRIAITDLLLLFSIEASQISMGYLIKLSPNFLIPNIIVTGSLCLALLYVVFCLPELIQKDPNAKLLDLKHVLRMAQLYFHKPGENLPGRVWKLRLLLLVLFLSAMSMVSSSAVDMLYLLNSPFCWTSTQIGWFNAINALIIQAGSFVGLLIMRKLLKIKEAYIAQMAMVLVFANKILVAFAQYEYMMYISCFVNMFFFLIIPMLRALMSEQVTHHEQGSLFASISAVENSCSLFGGTLFNSIYTATVAWFRGFVYFVIAAFYVLSFSVLSVYSCKTRGESPPVIEVETPEDDDEEERSRNRDEISS